MNSSLTNAYTIKLENFEGPFDLLFYLIEKNKVNIYDIPINEITDQYIDYLYSMQEMDMEIASEFLLMASTLLHIKSKLLLPDRKSETSEEEDTKEELITSLLRYRKYKDFSKILKEKEQYWSAAFYKCPELHKTDNLHNQNIKLNISVAELFRIYILILRKNRLRINKNSSNIRQILKRDNVTVKSKIREIMRLLFKKRSFIFNDWVSHKKQSKSEVVTGFMAVLQLAHTKKLKLSQKGLFADIKVEKVED